MPNRHSPDRLGERRLRALQRGYATPTYADTKSFVEVPIEMKPAAKSVIKSMLLHAHHQSISGEKAHFAWQATQNAANNHAITPHERNAANKIHQAAGKAKHDIPLYLDSQMVLAQNGTIDRLNLQFQDFHGFIHAQQQLLATVLSECRATKSRMDKMESAHKSAQKNISDLQAADNLYKRVAESARLDEMTVALNSNFSTLDKRLDDLTVRVQNFEIQDMAPLKDLFSSLGQLRPPLCGSSSLLAELDTVQQTQGEVRSLSSMVDRISNDLHTLTLQVHADIFNVEESVLAKHVENKERYTQFEASLRNGLQDLQSRLDSRYITREEHINTKLEEGFAKLQGYCQYKFQTSESQYQQRYKVDLQHLHSIVDSAAQDSRLNDIAERYEQESRFSLDLITSLQEAFVELRESQIEMRDQLDWWDNKHTSTLQDTSHHYGANDESSDGLEWED